jgi:hypothetical protein
LSGCGSSSPSSLGGNLTGQPTIHATVDWSIIQTKLLQSVGIPIDTTVTASVDVYTTGYVMDSTATVNVVLHGIQYLLTWQSAGSQYVTTSSHKIPVTAVKNGDMVVVTVKAGSTTYADSAIMPGGVLVSDDGASATWVTEGNFDQLVIDSLNTQTSIPDYSHPIVNSVEGSGGMTATADLTSPVTIPQTALTSGQSYEALVIVQREHVPFAGASVESGINMRQVYLKDYTKP